MKTVIEMLELVIKSLKLQDDLLKSKDEVIRLLKIKCEYQEEELKEFNVGTTTLVDRLRLIGISNEKQLAKVLKISVASVKRNKKKGAFPKRWLLKITKAKNVSVEWLLGMD